MDSIEFAADIILKKLFIPHKKEEVIIHPVCSVQKMGLLQKLILIGKASSNKLVIPELTGCCGMAGDRGFYYPGLLQSATKNESQEVKLYESHDCYSTGKPCEMSLSENTGKNYRSLFYLLDEISE